MYHNNKRTRGITTKTTKLLVTMRCIELPLRPSPTRLAASGQVGRRTGGCSKVGVAASRAAGGVGKWAGHERGGAAAGACTGRAASAAGHAWMGRAT